MLVAAIPESRNCMSPLAAWSREQTDWRAKVVLYQSPMPTGRQAASADVVELRSPGQARHPYPQLWLTADHTLNGPGLAGESTVRRTDPSEPDREQYATSTLRDDHKIALCSKRLCHFKGAFF